MLRFYWKKLRVATTMEKAKEPRIQPLVKLESFAVVGDDPRRTYKTVPKVVSKALQKANLTIDQMDLIEIQGGANNGY